MKQQQSSQLGADDVVWSLLQNWRSLDQAVVCKLLCCSQAMARLVRRTCQGRLTASMLTLDEVDADPDGLAPSLVPPMAESWVLHNARLLGSFGVDPHDQDSEFADDEPCAAGFAAACSRATSAAARLPGKRAAPLLLQQLVCGVPSRGQILCSVAGFTPHLTYLVLCVAEGWRPVSGCRAALASLTSLRALIIGGKDED